MTVPSSQISPREPDAVGVKLDPNGCMLLEGHQHEVSDVGELADSIAALGQLHPALVLECADGRRLIVAGRRRWLACQHLGRDLVANIWCCTSEEDVDIELFARAVRVAENVQRRDPSAMDVAIQLRTIRNERGFTSAEEVGAAVGMSASRVKQYLSLFRASDDLADRARTGALSLNLLVELVRCEKRLGTKATKKLTDKAVRGELSVRDIAKRHRPTTKKAAPTQRAKPKTERPMQAFLKLASPGQAGAEKAAEEMFEELLRRFPDLAERAKSHLTAPSALAADV